MRTKDGEVVRGDTAEERVASLRELSRDKQRSLLDFMRVSSARAMVQTGCVVRCQRADEFIADLVSAGLLYEEDEGDGQI